MELSVLMTFILGITYLQPVNAKSNPVIVTHDSKMRFSQKHNAVSTTAKPDTQLASQSHYVQNVPATPQQFHQLTLQPIQLQQQVVQQVPMPIATQLHPQSQQQILQLIQKVLFSTQQSNQPTAMIIIAQPAYLPPNVALGNTGQQLLNYFHNNPQARYQFVHGTVQPQPIAQYIPQPQLIQPTQQIASFPILSTPAQYQTKILPIQSSAVQTTHMSPVQASETYSQQVPLQLPQISSQIATQQYYQQIEPASRQNDVEYPSALPPIITGFENFTPEQQEKIKAQLSVHFGAPLKPLSINQKDSGNVNKYQLNTNEFIPSQELKGGRSNIMSVAKNAYTKM